VRIYLVFALLVSACFSSANAQNATLTFGSQDIPPFNQHKEGGASGPFADVIKAVCERIQTRCVILALPWRRGMAELNEGRLSGIFPLVHFPEREQDFYLVGPVTVGVYGPSGTSKIFERTIGGTPAITLEMELNNLTVLKKLSVGRYGQKGLGFVNCDVAQYLISQEHIANVHLAGDVQREGYYIGLSRKVVSAEVAAKFTQALTALKQSGELATILKNYGLAPASGAKTE